MEFVSLIIAILVIVLIIKFVMFLFTNYITSRILGTIAGIWAIVNAWTNPKETLLTLILTTFSWLFFIGPTVFDVEWDVSWDITSTSDGWHASPHMVGGFVSNAIGAFLVSCIPLLFGSDPITISVVPIIVLILNIVSFLLIFRR